MHLADLKQLQSLPNRDSQRMSGISMYSTLPGLPPQGLHSPVTSQPPFLSPTLPDRDLKYSSAVPPMKEEKDAHVGGAQNARRHQIHVF
jgi:hypothetical protein